MEPPPETTHLPHSQQSPPTFAPHQWPQASLEVKDSRSWCAVVILTLLQGQHPARPPYDFSRLTAFASPTKCCITASRRRLLCAYSLSVSLMTYYVYSAFKSSTTSHLSCRLGGKPQPVCRHKRAEACAWPPTTSAIFGRRDDHFPQATPILATQSAACSSGGSKRERSAAWRCCALFFAHSEPEPGRVCSRGDGKEAAGGSAQGGPVHLVHAVAGTVRLHAPSHARRLKLSRVLLDRTHLSHESRPLRCHWRAFCSHAMPPSVKGPAAAAPHLPLPSLPLPSRPIPSATNQTVSSRHSPQIFQSSPQAAHVGAALPSGSIVRVVRIPIWNGFDPHCGLTPTRFASPLVTNRPYC